MSLELEFPFDVWEETTAAGCRGRHLACRSGNLIIVYLFLFLVSDFWDIRLVIDSNHHQWLAWCSLGGQ
jgi:hypothetical protein